ncbi:MAG TPA: hypothetical protein VLC52_12730 [Anaerolineae bacterium]|nr:hypothetical protein [Anaerolineae bacterium]
MSQRTFFGGRAPVPASEIQIESVGVNPIDRRRIDVAVDLTPFREPVKVELVIVGPDDEELCSTVLLQNREWQLDRVLHLRRDAQPGEHILHVGVFEDDDLIVRAARSFAFPPAERAPGV